MSNKNSKNEYQKKITNREELKTFLNKSLLYKHHNNFLSEPLSEKEACEAILKFLKDYITIKRHIFSRPKPNKKIKSFVNMHKDAVRNGTMTL
jgi:hypothetical protein